MNTWHIAAKDLLLLVRDRRALVVLIALPLVFIAIIGMSTGKMLGWRNRNEQLRLAVFDEWSRTHAGQKPAAAEQEAPTDGSAEDTAADDETETDGPPSGEALVPEILKRLEEHKGVEVTLVDSFQAAQSLVVDEHYTAAIQIGPQFLENVDKLLPGDVFDAENSGVATNLDMYDIHVETSKPPTNASALTQLILQGDVMGVVAPYILKKDDKIRYKMRVDARRKKLRGDEPPPKKEEIDWTGTFGSVVYQKVVPSYTVMFAFFLVTLMSRSFLTERELGTYRRLKTTPVSPSELTLGKVAPYFLISLIQSALLFLAGRLMFGMNWGTQPWLLLPVIFATSAAATGLGMLIATVVRSEAQVTSVAMLVVLAMAGVSGCFTPRDWLPERMQQFSLATPHAWALIAYEEILNTATPHLNVVWESCGWLLGFAAIYFAIGLWRFRSMPV